MRETLVEYGAPIDPEIMVTPPDVTDLELEPGHPGLGDEGYIRRRKELFALCRKHRLESLGPPLIEYTPEETASGREVTSSWTTAHRARLPHPPTPNAAWPSPATTSWPRHLSEPRPPGNQHAPGPGRRALPYRTFYEYIAQPRLSGHAVHPPRLAPRVHPEPDMIHDRLGHVPLP
ncbi:MAG: hypothetical protein U0793_10090 [Gemmataceae bacterium]